MDRQASNARKHTLHVFGIWREFDMMQMQGGIQSFAERYGIDGKVAGRLQLCAEELIYEMLSGATPEGEAPDAEIQISYSEADRSILLALGCMGREYTPFTAADDDENHLGVTILRNIVKEVSFAYDNGRNEIKIKLIVSNDL